VAPPTRMDETQLVAEGYYSTYGKVRLVCIALIVMWLCCSCVCVYVLPCGVKALALCGRPK
jgi:aconitase B